VWPGLRRCETEIVAMVTSMLHGDPATCAGSMTSGGTESILLAIKAYRDQVFAGFFFSPRFAISHG
jgi:sphinganine-1-phosphate aldolase